MLKKRGLFFTIDAILAAGIIIVVLILATNIFVSEPSKVQESFTSQDSVRVFTNLKVSELDDDYVQSLISAGDITRTNNTILEQIGEFWAENQIELAKNFSNNTINILIPARFGFGVYVDGEEIFTRDKPIARNLISSRKIISGIAKEKPTEGFTSRVLLNGINSKKTSSYVYFSGYEGDGNLSKRLILPKDVVSFNSSYLEVDSGGNFSLYINNNPSGNYIKGSAGGGEMLADKWNLTGANLTYFKSGENNISINFTSGKRFFAGGFLKVAYTTSSYNDTTIPGYEKSYLPGIDGIINLFSAAYFPKLLENMSIYLHFLSDYQLFLTIGNSTIFESVGSENAQIVDLNSSNISASLDKSGISFSSLSEKTVPFRLGLREFFKVGGADTVLITDRTGSMSKCDVLSDCSLPDLCDSNPNGGCHRRRIVAAADSDRKFINIVLNETNENNNVALVGFGIDTNPVCDFHEFSNENNSLVNRTAYYKKSAWCGDTCISCGIYSATQLLTERMRLDELKEILVNDSTEYELGKNNFNSVTTYLNATFDTSKIVKSRLSVFGNKVNTDADHQDCVYFNDHYLGRMCESSGTKLDFHTCYYPIKPELFNTVNLSKNNATITGGSKNGCFGEVGSDDKWTLARVDLIAWQHTSEPKLIFNTSYNSDEFSEGVELNDSNITIEVKINISDDTYLELNKTKIRSAMLEFEAANGSPGKYNCVFANGNFIGRLDWQRWNESKKNAWQKVLFDVPAAFLHNGTNRINFTSGSSKECYGKPISDRDPWRFKNINLSVVWLDKGIKYNRNQSMLIMSDGKATEIIGKKNANSAEARAETIEKACEAHNKYGISIFAVAMGDAGDNPTEMLNATACCDDCSHFYRAESQQELLDAYADIAENIAKVGLEKGSQSIIEGAVVDRTILYPDSYIDFNYSIDPQFYWNKLPLSFESERFGNKISSGNLLIYPNTSLFEAKATSYSGTSWTDWLSVNRTLTFNLSAYGNYSTLGDPFTVNVPPSLIGEGFYNITVITGVNSSFSTNGSPDNRIVYTLLLKGASDYSGVVAKSDGCSWTINFEDGTSASIKVPSTYAGSDTCDFATAAYDTDDALDLSAYELFYNLDLDKDGLLDINIETNNLNIDSLFISKVPSLWGPSIVEIRVWE